MAPATTIDSRRGLLSSLPSQILAISNTDQAVAVINRNNVPRTPQLTDPVNKAQIAVIGRATTGASNSEVDASPSFVRQVTNGSDEGFTNSGLRFSNGLGGISDSLGRRSSRAGRCIAS